MEKLLLVGSMPFDSAEEALRTASGMLGPYLDTLPDGEVLDRRYWVLRMAFQVFNGHPALETLQYPRAEPGHEKLVPADLTDVWRFRLRPGMRKIAFDMPGWRLGYAKDAQNSFAIFSALKREGKIPKGMRFQVSLPSVNSVCNPVVFGTDLEPLAIIRAGFLEALVAETENICRLVPAEELAIQFDCSFEITDAYGGAGLPIESSIARNTPQFQPLTAVIPAGVKLGFHLCFGTFGGWPRFAPDDLGRTVDFANALRETVPREIDWIHVPALNTVDDAFYAPLARLRHGNTRIFLGLIHSMDTFVQRYEVARRHLDDFGIGAYCGFGRLTLEDTLSCFHDHVRAIELARGVESRRR